MFASCAQCRGQKAKSLVSNRRKAKGAGAPSLVTVVGKSVRAPAFAAASSPSPEQPPSLPPLITAGALQGRKQGPGRTDAWRRRGGASASARRSSRGRGSIRASWPHSSPTTAPELADAAPRDGAVQSGSPPRYSGSIGWSPSNATGRRTRCPGRWRRARS
jgi:hypothetical protein